MRDLLPIFPFLLLMACGGAQSQDVEAVPAQTANDDVDSEEPAANASQPESDEGDAANDADGVTALEDEDLSAHGADPSGGETTSSPYSVARGHSGGGLRTRRESSMPEEARRAQRVPTPETLDTETVEAFIRDRVREVHFCYEREFRHRPDVSGRIIVGATIAPDGHVSEARILSSTIRSARVDQCVIQTFSRWEFPPAQAPTTIEHPFMLMHH